MTFPKFVVALVLASALAAAVPAGAQQLYWLDTRFATPTLNRANPDGSSPHSLSLPAGSLPEGLVLDPVTRALFWTEATFSGARVRRCGLDFSFVTDVLTGGSALRGIAVDGAGGRLFWTTSNIASGPTIRRANVNGTSATTLLTLGGAANPRGIAYSATPAPAAIYVCDPGNNGLYKYDPNGVGGLMLGLPPNTRPYGLAVDGAGNQVYYTEYGMGDIQRCSTTGGARTFVLGGLVNPTYIALDVPGSKMYWVQGGAGAQKVMRASLSGTSPVNLGLPLTAYGGIAFAPASLITGVDESPVLELALGAVSPNPALGQARIDFALPGAGAVRLSAFDVQGREVALLVDGTLEAGRHTAVLEAGTLRAGMYFVRMQAQGLSFMRRLVVVR